MHKPSSELVEQQGRKSEADWLRVEVKAGSYSYLIFNNTTEF